MTYGGKLYYNPGLPEVRAFVREAMLHAVRRYPVDAVHFDDYFYPYPVAGQTFDDDLAYDTHGGAFPDRAAWRRDNVDRLVRETAAGIRAVRPGTRFGISPFGVWRNAATDPRGSATQAGVQTYDDLHADTRRWAREKLDRLHLPAAVLAHRLRRRRLRRAASLVGRGRPGLGDPAVRGGGAVQGGRSGAARALGGPGGTVPPPHAGRPVPTGARARVLRRP